MRAFIITLCLVVWGYLVPGLVYSQTVKAGTYPKGNETVGIEQFEWVAADLKSPVAIRFTIRNKAKNKNIKSVQFALVASDAQGIILQQDGTTLRKLSKLATIEPEQAETFYFEKAFTVTPIADISLKQVIVEYSNGSLEILSK